MTGAGIANKDFAQLADEVLGNPKYAGKTVLVCWHHGTLTDLARKLGAADAPERYKDSAFDRVWQLCPRIEGRGSAGAWLRASSGRPGTQPRCASRRLEVLPLQMNTR